MSTGPLLRTPDQPVPTGHPSRLSQPYWDACSRSELRYQRCLACGHANHRPAPVCSRCHHLELEWALSGGRGTLYSWTVVWRAQHPAFEVPYAPAIIELDEGCHLISAMVGCRPEDLAAGRRVVVEFHRSADVTLPYFGLETPTSTVR